MKLLIFDTRFPKGHKDLNNRIVKILSEQHQLIVMNNNNFYTCCDKNIEYVDVDVTEYVGKSVFCNQLSHLKNIFHSYLKVRNFKYDRILFQTIDISSFLLCLLLFPNKIKYVIYHNNADQLCRMLKRLCFNIYRNKIYHLTFADSIADYLISLGAPKQRVFVIPHPIPTLPQLQFKSDNRQRFMNALCGANDDNWVNQIFDYEESTKRLEQLETKIRLRTAVNRHNKMIEIINNYLSFDEYIKYYIESEGVIVLLPQDYQYRYSGVIKDALAFKTLVYVSDSAISREFSTKYPNNVKIFKDVEQLFDFISQKFTFSEDEYKKFYEFHSDKNISQTFENLFAKSQKV